MHGRRHPSLRPIPDRKASDATFETSPLPRHVVSGRVHPSLAASRAAHPSNYRNNVINDDTASDDHNGPSSLDDDRSRTRGANVSPVTRSAGGDAVSCTHRQSDRAALGAVRPRRSAMGDRDRMARIELPSRRDQSDRMRGPVSACDPLAFRSVCESRVLRLANGRVRTGSEHSGGRSPVLVVGAFALAIVIWTVILEAVL